MTSTTPTTDPAPVRADDLDARLADVEVVLCDADGNLFPSEEPAFVASADVTNRLLATLGVDRRYDAEEPAAGDDRHELPVDRAGARRRARRGPVGRRACSAGWPRSRRRSPPTCTRCCGATRPSSSRCGWSPGATAWPRSARAPTPASRPASTRPAWPTCSHPTVGSAPRTRCPARSASPTRRSTGSRSTRWGSRGTRPSRSRTPWRARRRPSGPASRRSATCSSCRRPSGCSAATSLEAAGVLAVVGSWQEAADLLPRCRELGGAGVSTG
nr:hypothetical protein [Angustibacter aerolatus]